MKIDLILKVGNSGQDHANYGVVRGGGHSGLSKRQIPKLKQTPWYEAIGITR